MIFATLFYALACGPACIHILNTVSDLKYTYTSSYHWYTDQSRLRQDSCRRSKSANILLSRCIQCPRSNRGYTHLPSNKGMRNYLLMWFKPWLPLSWMYLSQSFRFGPEIAYASALALYSFHSSGGQFFVGSTQKGTCVDCSACIVYLWYVCNYIWCTSDPHQSYLHDKHLLLTGIQSPSSGSTCRGGFSPISNIHCGTWLFLSRDNVSIGINFNVKVLPLIGKFSLAYFSCRLIFVTYTTQWKFV